MKRIILRLAVLLLVLVLLPVTPGMAAEKLIKGNLRIVIGSKSTGGDTYQNSSIVAEALAKKLDINVKVDAVGATAAFRTIARMGARGNTIMIFHDQSYLGFLYGVTGYENIFEKYIVGPTVAINPGNAYLVPMIRNSSSFTIRKWTRKLSPTSTRRFQRSLQRAQFRRPRRKPSLFPTLCPPRKPGPI